MDLEPVRVMAEKQGLEHQLTELARKAANASSEKTLPG